MKSIKINLIRLKFNSSILIASFLMLSGCYDHSPEEQRVRTNAPLMRDWDISSKSNILVLDFDADWGSPYQICFALVPIHGKWTQVQHDAVYDFIGDGTTTYSEEDPSKMILKYPGINIPIHIKVEQFVGGQKTLTTVIERDVNTAGTTGGTQRKITYLKLDSGHYRISINVTDDIKLPINTTAIFQLDRRRYK